MSLPTQFCWTRFGTEAGESIDAIVRRKEAERRANGGVFLWGIGSAIGPSMRALIDMVAEPQAVFTPIKSKPKMKDSSPSEIVVWTTGTDLDGNAFELPRNSVVTSRYEGRGSHYALVCASKLPLEMKDTGENLLFGEVRNLRSNRPVGATQVTCVVNRLEVAPANRGTSYPIYLRIDLVFPFLVELGSPISLPPALRSDKSDLLRASLDLVEFARNADRRQLKAAEVLTENAA